MQQLFILFLFIFLVISPVSGKTYIVDSEKSSITFGIKEIRKNAEQILGVRFDIREFHDKLLEQGSLPLDILENKMAKYIREKADF